MTSLKRGRWSTPELARLREMFPRSPIERVAQALGRSADSVRAQAAKLFAVAHAGRDPHDPALTREEEELLRRGHGVVTIEDLALALGRVEDVLEACLERFRESMRSGDWGADEVALLKDLYSSRSDEVLEACLSRSRTEIEKMAEEYCLRKDKGAASRIDPTQPTRMPRWSADEVAVLERRYPVETNLAIARDLGRSVTSVANKAHQLGLKKAEELRRKIGAENALGRRVRGI